MAKKSIRGISSVVVLLLFFVLGCSVQRKSGEQLGQESLDELLRVPTTFGLSYAEDAVAWDRAMLFFKEYTSGFKYLISSRGPNLIEHKLITSDTGVDSYLCEVNKTERQADFIYSVSCSSNDDSISIRQVKLNTHNLARFIREGRLEVSLFD